MPKRIKNCPVIGCDKSGCRSYDGVPYCGTHGSKAHYNGCHINEDGTLATSYECFKCGGLIVSPKSKVKLCNDCRSPRPVELVDACLNCGKAIGVNSKYGKKYCSLRCRRKLKDARRRARKVKAYVSDVSFRALMERDSWTCMICSKAISKTLTAPHPLSASIDHIVPLFQGGTHEMRNVQATHWICNSSKSHRSANDQLLLFG